MIMPENLFFKDIKLTNRALDQQVSDRYGVDLEASLQKDLKTVSGRANLAQAIINRLLTRRGELAPLGHPEYGSRLWELMGEPNNVRVRGLAEIYIRECLAQESRIREIPEIAFAPINRQRGRHELNIRITVRPIGDEEDLAIILPINL